MNKLAVKKLAMWKTGTRKTYIIAALFLALAGAACKGKHNEVAVQNEEPDPGPRMLSTVRMGDTTASAQLLKGFYAVENNLWRWTAGKFSVLLKTPAGAAQSGATVSLVFTVPDPVIQKLRKLSLTASINGMALKTEEYTTAGPYTFSADIPAALLGTESVKVDFALDKSLPPGVDKRELGVIASSVGLVSK
jgi:hypothetical protein